MSTTPPDKRAEIEIPAIIEHAREHGCENDAQIIGYLAAEVSRLRSLPHRETGAREDSKRLDWLEYAGNRIHGWHVDWISQDIALKQSPHVYQGISLRDAIDTHRARAATREWGGA